MRPYRVMTVCHGNICRSPIAEVVLRARLDAAGLADRVAVDSTGISDEEEGGGIDRRAAAVLAEAGYDVPRHRARQVSGAEIGERDLLLAMTSRHAQWLRRQAPDPASADRVVLYRSFDPAADGDLDIADPWYGDRSDFETTLAQVEAGADGVVEHVRRALADRGA